MTTTAPAGDRYLSIDAVRGFAVLGILLMNIVSMGMPAFAYVDPTYYGGSTGANLWVWGASFVLADGKMRALFTMLYGASLLLIADRAARGDGMGPVQTHYRRSFWLLLFGIAHGCLLWYGDILVFYAIAGALAFLLRKLDARVQIGVGLAVFFALMGWEFYDLQPLLALKHAAEAPGAAPAAIAAFREAAAQEGPPPEVLQINLAAFRGDFLDATQFRVHQMIRRHTGFSRTEYVEAFGLILVGMGLFRSGFFTLKWPTRAYGAMIAVGYLVCLPITLWMAMQVTGSGFNRIINFEMMTLSEAPRLPLALAHASVILLLVRAGAGAWLTGRLAAAGRMAFSNYLGTSLLTSLFFNGYGLGFFGDLQRYQLYFVVAGVWTLILLWSKPWLERFHYGPLEWVWRSLVQWKPQPFARPAGHRLAPAE